MWSQLDHVEEIILLFLHQIHKYWKIIDIVKEQEKRSTNSLSCFWKFSSSNSITKSSLIPTWQEYSNFCFFSSIFKGNFKFFDILITTNFQNLFFSKSFWRFSIDSSYLPLFFECAVQIFLIWYGYYLVTFFRVLNFETFYFLIWFQRMLWIWETTRPWKGDLRSFVESLGINFCKGEVVLFGDEIPETLTGSHTFEDLPGDAKEGVRFFGLCLLCRLWRLQRVYHWHV